MKGIALIGKRSPNMKKRNYIDEAGHEWPTESDQGLSKPAHTPAPWFFHFADHYIAKHGPEWEITSEKNNKGIWTAHCQSATDAAFIVRAVNYHEALLEIVKEDRGRYPDNSGRAKELDELIANAEGK